MYVSVQTLVSVSNLRQYLLMRKKKHISKPDQYVGMPTY